MTSRQSLSGRTFALSAAFSVLLFPCLALAALNVVADVGGQDAAPFFEGIHNSDAPPQVLPVRPQAVEQGEAAMLPVSTPEMTPGPVDDRALQLPGIGALFLVGDDPASRVWLTQNARALAARHAAGLVVNVSDIGALQALRARAPGIALAPASGSQLARRLQLEHYPVLITDTGLSQQVLP